MTTNRARQSQLSALRHRAKNATHVCGDCPYRVEQHKLGRSAHDRMASHVAVQHRKYLDRDCQGGRCKASPFTPRERRGMAFQAVS